MSTEDNSKNTHDSNNSNNDNGSAQNHVEDTPGDRAAAGGSRPTLDPNEAIQRAAEQSKSTADKNMPAFGDLPVEEDTANLRMGPNLHDGLLALLPLVGVWRGQGQAEGPDGQYTFGQQIVFAHDGNNYLSYSSRTWKLDDKGEPAGPDQRETGFMRINDADEIEFTITHAAGVVEIFYGEPLNERAWQLESSLTTVTTTGPEKLGPGKRLYGLMPNNDLGWVDERMVDGKLTPRMSAQLHRFAG